MSVIDRDSTRSGGGATSLIPARLDRMRWSSFHTRLVVGLGIAWIIDGLEIQIASLSEGFISKPASLNLSASSVAFSVGTIYLLGEVAGALFFGRMSDKWGRKNLFMITLGVYLFGGVLTACTAGKGQGWVIFLDVTRFIAGMGIGGEYAAINSAIDELIPSKYRGRVDIGVNGTYWAGALIATILSLAVVNHLPVSWGWRLGFLFGPILGFMILFVRRNLPESPRWLLMHGRTEEAEKAVTEIERRVRASGGTLEEVDESKALALRDTPDIGIIALARTLFTTYPTRAILGATLMMTQAFLYNAIFFNYTTVLENVYHVKTGDVEYYFMAFAVGNFAGPLLLGRFFDSVGRKRMITGCYVVASVVLALSALVFKLGGLDAVGQTAFWCVTFFFASAGASAAYLTVSEIFPVEVRAKAIAVFFCIAQSVGAFAAWLYGVMVGNGNNHDLVVLAYLIGAAVMFAGGIVELFLGVDAEGLSLEEISAIDGSAGFRAPTGAPRPPAARSVVDLSEPRVRRGDADAGADEPDPHRRR